MKRPTTGAGRPNEDFQLTPEEHAWAKRIFSASRRTEPGTREEVLGTFAFVVEDMAKGFPLHSKPQLRIVSGGAK